MILKPITQSIAWLLILLAGACTTGKPIARTYKPASETLFRDIARQDSLMFDAFNRHDLDGLMSFFTEDLEFYHDKGGLTGYEQTRLGFERLFTQNATTGLRRTLIPGSLEVYPVKGYGAIEESRHRFCHLEQEKQDCGTFKNTMIWRKTDKGWKVSRVLSYDH